jgi:hypothetical protein
MSPRIVGPSGVELDVDVEMARGLVRDGFAVLAEGESKALLNRVDPEDDVNGLKQGEIRALFAAPAETPAGEGSKSPATSTDEGGKAPAAASTDEGTKTGEK